MLVKAKKSSKFKKVDPDTIRENIDSIGRSDRPYYIKKEFPMYKYKNAPEGNFVRILPPVEDRDFMLKIGVHSYVGVEEGSYICLAKTLEKPCPICEKMKEAQERGNKDLAKKLFPRTRYIFQVVDTSKAPQEGVLVLDAPVTLGEEILSRCEDPKTRAPFDISDLKEGREIYFKREMQNIPVKTPSGQEVMRQMPEYKNVQLGETHRISEDLAEEVVPFTDLLQIPSFEELKGVAKYAGGELTKRFTGEDEEPPVGKKRVVKLRKKLED